MFSRLRLGFLVFLMLGGHAQGSLAAEPGRPRGSSPREANPRPDTTSAEAHLPRSATPTSPAVSLPRDAAVRLSRRGVVSFPSVWNGQVHVRQRGRLRTLHLGRRLDIVQTRMHLDRPASLISPYQRCLVAGLALFDPPEPAVRRVAMIGLGGGALTRFFHLKRPGWVFHSVEIDPVVVAVARAFFGVVDGQGYQSFAMDGRRFIEEAVTPYDVIIIDAFDAGAQVPTVLASQEFFHLLKSRLTPQGLVVMNFLVHSRRTYASLLKTLETVFPRVARFPLKRFGSRNVLLVAPRDPARLLSRAAWRARAAEVERAFAAKLRLTACVDALNQDQVATSKVSVIRDTSPGGKSPEPATAP